MAADRIILTGIEVTARHGVYAAEKVTPQLFRIDLDCSLAASASQDDLATTVDYSRLAQAVAEVVGGLYERHIGSIEQVGGINQDEFKQMNRALQRLDRFWNDTIAYRM